jgi:hypothetical protein
VQVRWTGITGVQYRGVAEDIPTSKPKMNAPEATKMPKPHSCETFVQLPSLVSISKPGHPFVILMRKQVPIVISPVLASSERPFFGRTQFCLIAGQGPWAVQSNAFLSGRWQPSPTRLKRWAGCARARRKSAVSCRSRRWAEK